MIVVSLYITHKNAATAIRITTMRNTSRVPIRAGGGFSMGPAVWLAILSQKEPAFGGGTCPARRQAIGRLVHRPNERFPSVVVIVIRISAFRSRDLHRRLLPNQAA